MVKNDALIYENAPKFRNLRNSRNFRNFRNLRNFRNNDIESWFAIEGATGLQLFQSQAGQPLGRMPVELPVDLGAVARHT